MAQHSSTTNRQQLFEKQFAWQKPFEHQVIERVKVWTSTYQGYQVATPLEDMEMSFDLKMLVHNKSIRIAARLRRSNVWQRDFTIRSQVPSSAKTELDKMKEGIVADLYFYGWLKDENQIGDYAIVDVQSFVESGLLDKRHPQLTNTDGTKFICIPIESMLNSTPIAMVYSTSNGMIVKHKGKSKRQAS